MTSVRLILHIIYWHWRGPLWCWDPNSRMWYKILSWGGSTAAVSVLHDRDAIMLSHPLVMVDSVFTLKVNVSVVSLSCSQSTVYITRCWQMHASTFLNRMPGLLILHWHFDFSAYYFCNTIRTCFILRHGPSAVTSAYYDQVHFML
jgi:hypothetical protein